MVWGRFGTRLSTHTSCWLPCALSSPTNLHKLRSSRTWMGAQKWWVRSRKKRLVIRENPRPWQLRGASGNYMGQAASSVLHTFHPKAPKIMQRHWNRMTLLNLTSSLNYFDNTQTHTHPLTKVTGCIIKCPCQWSNKIFAINVAFPLFWATKNFQLCEIWFLLLHPLPLCRIRHENSQLNWPW